MFKRFQNHPFLFFANIFVLLNLLFVAYLFFIKPKLNKKDEFTEYVQAAMQKKNAQNGLTLQNKNTPTIQHISIDQQIVDSIYDAMSYTERAAQMIMIGTSEKKGIGLPYPQVKSLIKNKIAGGVLFLKGNSEHFKNQRIELDTVNQSNPIKQWYACDCEPALFHKKFMDMDSLPPGGLTNNIQTLDSAVSVIVNRMNSMGLQINFAPVSDIAINQEIINMRSFGNNPQKIIEMSNEFIQNSRAKQIFCAIKHFPGHGAVTGDTHKEQVFIDGNLTELNTFKTIIQQAQPDFVMVGHMSIENNPQYATNKKPCTISRNIVTGLLKKELDYQGIVVSDAMNMAAVKRYPDADWLAVLAGIDLVLMPMNANSLNIKISNALKQNSPFSKELEKSIKKIIKLKLQIKN